MLRDLVKAEIDNSDSMLQLHNVSYKCNTHTHTHTHTQRQALALTRNTPAHKCNNPVRCTSSENGLNWHSVMYLPGFTPLMANGLESAACKGTGYV